MNFDKNICKNIEYIKNKFCYDKNADIIIREFENKKGVKCFLAYIDGMANTIGINDFIIRAIMINNDDDFNIFDTIQYNNLKAEISMDKAAASILLGDTLVYADGDEKCAIVETKAFEKRSVSSPDTESVIKGSHEGYTESIRTSITLLRRIIKSPKLCTEFVSVGKINDCKCAIMYLDNLTSDELVNKVKFRLNNIKGDFISGAGMVEQLIEDSTWSLFPSILSTERPDRTAEYLAAGRIAVICDNTPFALIMPISLAVLLDSPEGNQQRWQSGTFSRIIRTFAFILSILLSGIFLALTCFHHELIPSQLLTIITETRRQIPFSAVAEYIVMEIFFELVREAGLRVPNAIGSAIGVVGGLILGQAAVEAGIVSPVTLIIVAISGIANAVIPDYELSSGIRVLKFGFIILGGTLGFLGIGAGIILALTMLAKQSSFGVSMLSSSSKQNSTNGNMIYQRPIWKQELRAFSLKPKSLRQQPQISRLWAVMEDDHE
ncbi:MAG: spore germination protein [Clostridia bacterium]|nr:spore germination protein [Clostridia bacterium]